MDSKEIVNQEINRLSIQIACLRYDWEQATRRGVPSAFTAIIAQEIVELEHQRKCLRLGNYKYLPYNIKLLYNSQKQ